MKRALKMMATLLFVALCIGLVPADAASGKVRLRHPMPNLPDVFDIASQIVVQAGQILPGPRIVYIAPKWPVLEWPARLMQERPRKPAPVNPDLDRALERSRTR